MRLRNMETFPASHHWPFVRGIPRPPENVPNKGLVMRTIDLLLDVIWNKVSVSVCLCMCVCVLNENGTCWMRTVLAEWERYLQQFEIGWNASDRSYFSIPVWNNPKAYHLRNSVCTCDPWNVYNVIRTYSQTTYFFTWITPYRLCTYHLKKCVSTGLR